MKLQVEVDEATGRDHGREVQDLRLRQRDRELVARHRVDQGQDDRSRRSTIKNTDIVEELSLPPIKIHCSVLAEDAIKAAIGDYLKKKGGKDGNDRRSRKKRQRDQANPDDRSHGHGTILRVQVVGGGCSGMSYKLGFEEPVGGTTRFSRRTA